MLYRSTNCDHTGYLCACLLALLILPGLLQADEYLHGHVVGISDGDTLTLLTTDKEQVRIRLAEIDTPEKRQPYGTRAKQALSEMVFDRDVRIIVVDHDRYGRVVGRVYIGDVDVCAQMVAQGHAWVYRKYSRDTQLLRLEEEARNQRIGLWSLPESDRMPPWEWRRNNH